MDGQIEKPDEPTEALYLTKSEVEALLIGIPEMFAGVKFRLDYFSNKDKAIPELMADQKISEKEALQECEDNVALCQSLIEEYASITAELKEIYPMLQKTEEEKKSPIINPKDVSLTKQSIRLDK